MEFSKENGVYDVRDYAKDVYSINNIPVTLTASWKEGIDDPINKDKF